MSMVRPFRSRAAARPTRPANQPVKDGSMRWFHERRNGRGHGHGGEAVPESPGESRSALAERRIEQSAAFAELEQRRLELAEVLARKLAGSNGSGGGPRRIALRFERGLDPAAGRSKAGIRLVGGAEDRWPKPKQSAAPLLRGAGTRLFALLVSGGSRWLRRAAAPYCLNELDPLVPENALHAANGIALAVEQVTNPTQQIDVVGPIIAPAAAAFHRLDLGEPGLPETQHVLRQVEFVGDFADGAERVRRLFHCGRLLRSMPCDRRSVPR